MNEFSADGLSTAPLTGVRSRRFFSPHVHPRLPLGDTTHVRSADSKLTRNEILGGSFAKPLIGACNERPRELGSSRDSTPPSVVGEGFESALLYAVTGILGVGAKKHVCRVDAEPVVAVVTDAETVRNWASAKSERETVNVLITALPSADVQTAIAVLHGYSQPQKASGVGFVDALLCESNGGGLLHVSHITPRWSHVARWS